MEFECTSCMSDPPCPGWMDSFHLKNGYYVQALSSSAVTITYTGASCAFPSSGMARYVVIAQFFELLDCCLTLHKLLNSSLKISKCTSPHVDTASDPGWGRELVGGGQHLGRGEFLILYFTYQWRVRATAMSCGRFIHVVPLQALYGYNVASCNAGTAYKSAETWCYE